MREARREMMQPVHDKVDEAVMKVCIDNKYDYVLNTDDRAYIAINPQSGNDITEQVKKELKVE
jgi:Skp family chaperone for outer membrane proteins